MHSKEELLTQIADMDTIEKSNQVRDAIRRFKEQASTRDYETVRIALSKRINEIIDQGEQEIAETDEWLRANGYKRN